ncbi:enoyl-CoA hydratase-related protein [Pseudomonas lini]
MSESLMVSYEVEGVVAVITVNNPPVNALTPEMRGSIIDAVAHANADPAVAAIVLIGGRSEFHRGC